MTPPGHFLTWVVPLYRNGGFAAELIRRTRTAARTTGIRCEIVLVDDGCPENSGRQAAEAARHESAADVRIVTLPANRGQDAAIREGLRAGHGSHALIIDGDLQDPPEILGQLWPVMMHGGCDVVFAARFGAYESGGRLATSWFYRNAMEWVGGLPPRAGVCALLNREAIRGVTGTRVRRLSMLAALAGARLRCVSVPVRREARTQGSSAYGSWARFEKAAHSLIQTVRARWLRMPL